MAGDHDRRQAAVLRLEPLQQRDPVHAWHQAIDHQASFPDRPVHREKFLGTGITLRRVAVFLKQFLHRLARAAVVVDHVNSGFRATANRDTHPSRVHPVWLWRRGKERLDLLDQRFRVCRLAEIHTVGIGDLAQRIAGNVTSQNNSRYFAAQRRAQPRDNLGAGQLPRQVVIGDDDIRHNSPPDRRCKRFVRSGDGSSPVSLSFEEHLQHLPQSGIVLDN